MQNKFLGRAVVFSALLFTLSANAGNIHVMNQEDVEVTITVRPDNGGPLDPKDHMEASVQPNAETDIHVDAQKFGKHFHVKGQVGTVMLEHDKLPTDHDYTVVYSKSPNGGAIDVFTKLEKKSTHKNKAKHKAQHKAHKAE